MIMNVEIVLLLQQVNPSSKMSKDEKLNKVLSKVIHTFTLIIDIGLHYHINSPNHLLSFNSVQLSALRALQ
mgnify:CR=1 FL=1